MGRGSKRRCSDPLQKKHALHLAAIGGTVNIIRLILQKKLDVDARCHFGLTPLPLSIYDVQFRRSKQTHPTGRKYKRCSKQERMFIGLRNEVIHYCISPSKLPK